jgi:hypothetical protein
MRWLFIVLLTVATTSCQSSDYVVNTACHGSFAAAAGWQASDAELRP